MSRAPKVWRALTDRLGHVWQGWRPLGAKWYGEHEVAMRETAEWRGRAISRISWERLPDDHPQAIPIWSRLRAKRKRLRQQASCRTTSLSAKSKGAARPAWDETITLPMPLKANGLRSAQEREPPPRPKDLGLRVPD